MLKIIDFIGRLQVAKDIFTFVIDKYNILREAEETQIQERIAQLMASGKNQKIAEATALWELNYISNEGYRLILSLYK